MNSKWEYTFFSDLFEWGQKSNIGSREGKTTGKYPLYIASATEIKYYDKYIESGESLIFGTGGNPCIHYVNGNFAYTNHTEVAKKKNNNICTKFYYYYFQKDKYSLLSSTFVGGGIKNSSKKKIGLLLVPIIPKEEQERIVSRIEELFSELDSGIETLKKTKEQLRIYRQAVLKEAFEGKYTEKYHNSCKYNSDIENDLLSIKKINQIYNDIAGDENEIRLDIPDSWKIIRMGDVFSVQIGSTPKRSITEYWNGNICWVSSGEVKFCLINNTKEHITQSGVNNSSTNIQPIGTVLLAMIGEGKTRGQAAILNVPAAHNQNTAAILVSETPCVPKYIFYYLMLSYEYTRRVGSGNNQKALNKDRVRALHFPFTSFQEQREIVDEIETRMSVCENIENTVNSALSQAEALRQSILKEAFEGRL